jgi:16S rRNA (guanine527-N7)-methyltransferase
VNPTGGASSLSVKAGTDVVTTLLPPRDDWSGLAGASGQQLGVSLDADALRRFARYRDLLLERSAQFNLTAIREPEEIEQRLFLDAIAMIPELDRLADGVGDRAGHSPRLIDVGAGAGFPGLALKIVRPHLDVTLVDATAKKVAFVNEVITALELKHVAEELRRGRRAAAALGVEIVSTAALAVGTTRLVVVRKIAPTAALYPRRVGIPSRDPLGERS